MAKVNDMVVFVPYVVPGDVVDLQVKRKKHSYAEAVAVNFHKYSDVRTEPMCSHFGVCGGCTYQNLPYEEQLKMKEVQVKLNEMMPMGVEILGAAPLEIKAKLLYNNLNNTILKTQGAYYANEHCHF